MGRKRSVWCAMFDVYDCAFSTGGQLHRYHASALEQGSVRNVVISALFHKNHPFFQLVWSQINYKVIEIPYKKK